MNTQPVQPPMQQPVQFYRPFQLDRTVTIGLVFTLLAQTAAGLIWTGSAAARLDALEQQYADSADISTRLAHLEGQTGEITQSLSRIERELLRDQ